MALQERDLNVPRKTPPAHKSASMLSRLPRRVETPPKTTVSTSKGSSSVADRVAAATRASYPASKLNAENDAVITPPSHKLHSTGRSVDKPLPREKPLPSRPIACLTRSLSPSKDSRGLIDASEKPLSFVSASGQTCEWPALKPRPAIATPDKDMPSLDTAQQDTTSSGAPAPPATAASVVAAAANLTQVVTGRSSFYKTHDDLISPSPRSSYVSASEHSPPEQNDGELSSSIKTCRGSIPPTLQTLRYSASAEASPSVDFVTGQTSLRDRTSEGSFVIPSPGPSHHRVGFTDFTKDGTASPSTANSRHHSPSPASFSRPRTGSFSNGNGRPKSLKTASRIPIPDSKKATVVEVKKNRGSSSSSSMLTPVPTFGSRRLASPDALKILENGKLRRQLKRMHTEGSLSRLQTEGSWEEESNCTASTFDTPSLSHSIDTSPDGTLAPSSPEGGQDYSSIRSDVTPVTSFEHKIKGQMHETPSPWDDSMLQEDVSPNEETNSEADLEVCRHSHPPPPPTSPFTLPLQTIHSATLLPADDAPMDEDIYTELTHALCHLEGKGSPPKTDVDHQTLLSMFGHLKQSPKKSAEDGGNLAENAAAAEKYLVQNASVISHAQKDAEPPQGSARNTVESKIEMKEPSSTTKSKPTTMSKWSDSTPSDNAFSPQSPRDELSPIQIYPVPKSRLSPAGSKASSYGTLSIGYPFRIPGPTPEPAEQSPEDAATAPAVSRRRSSPTLGKHTKTNKPGSVRTAREGIKLASASFTRPTASAQLRKIARMPTPNTKALILPDTSPRGRESSAQRSRSRNTGGATPKPDVRSQSKSRYVLDKINGLFSGRRERRDSEVPPVPRIRDSLPPKDTPVELPAINRSIPGSPASIAISKTKPLPKMPSLSPSSHIAFQTASSFVKPLPDEIGVEDSFAESKSVENLSMRILDKAKRESNQERKARLLNFAKVLNDSLISAREAQISAETAHYAAKSAQLSYEMTQKGLAVLHKLADSMARSGSRTGR